MELAVRRGISRIRYQITQTIVRNLLPKPRTLSEEERAARMELVGERECVYCGARAQLEEHFRALIGVNGSPSGFGNCLWNMVPCCSPCNRSKLNRPWRTFMHCTTGDAPLARASVDVTAHTLRIMRLDKFERFGASLMDTVDVHHLRYLKAKIEAGLSATAGWGVTADGPATPLVVDCAGHGNAHNADDAEPSNVHAHALDVDIDVDSVDAGVGVDVDVDADVNAQHVNVSVPSISSNRNALSPAVVHTAASTTRPRHSAIAATSALAPTKKRARRTSAAEDVRPVRCSTYSHNAQRPPSLTRHTVVRHASSFKCGAVSCSYVTRSRDTLRRHETRCRLHCAVASRTRARLRMGSQAIPAGRLT